MKKRVTNSEVRNAWAKFFATDFRRQPQPRGELGSLWGSITRLINPATALSEVKNVIGSNPIASKVVELAAPVAVNAIAPGMGTVASAALKTAASVVASKITESNKVSGATNISSGYQSKTVSAGGLASRQLIALANNAIAAGMQPAQAAKIGASGGPTVKQAQDFVQAWVKREATRTNRPPSSVARDLNAKVQAAAAAGKAVVGITADFVPPGMSLQTYRGLQNNAVAAGMQPAQAAKIGVSGGPGVKQAQDYVQAWVMDVAGKTGKSPSTVARELNKVSQGQSSALKPNENLSPAPVVTAAPEVPIDPAGAAAAQGIMDTVGSILDYQAPQIAAQVSQETGVDLTTPSGVDAVTLQLRQFQQDIADQLATAAKNALPGTVPAETAAPEADWKPIAAIAVPIAVALLSQ